MHLPILQDTIILLGFSVVIVFLLQRIKRPSILGFLITGILIGPHALSLISNLEAVETISEIGVIMLLFVIGMELSIKQLIAMKKTVLMGGALQVGITILVAASIYYLLGNTLKEAIFIGFLFSLSSTAIVLKILHDQNEINAPHGRNALAILIFQDIIIVPMMLFTPIIAGQASNVAIDIMWLLLKMLAIAGITIVSAKYIFPQFIHIIAKTRSKELFLLSTIATCFLVTFLTAEAGLSLGLGAFLAGLIISESEYNHQATSIILPFRELFTSFFFISVGMMLDVSFVWQHGWQIILLLVSVIIIKTVIAGSAVALLRYPPRTVILTGFALFQIGEFSFILSKIGIQYNLINHETNQYFLAISILSMLLTPFMITYSEKIASKILIFYSPKKRYAQTMTSSPNETALNLHNHLVIIGYGINGSNLAKAAQYIDIPYVVIELNANTVKREKEKGIPILFGDATQPHILEAVNIESARAVVVAISDAKATKTIIKNIRMYSQSVFLLVRTRFVNEISELYELSADDVIPEEFETSVQILSQVLHNFLIPEDDIEQFTEIIRADNYEIFQNRKKKLHTFKPTQFPDFNITCMRVNTDSGKFIGKPLKELDLRVNYGVNIVGISRKNSMIDNVQPHEVLHFNDIVFVNGKPEDIEYFRGMLN